MYDQMAPSFGYAAPSYGHACPGPSNNSFVLIVVLFILLIIIGSCYNPKC
ncbi:YjcZ family sporulation protein [Bacillus sp. PS06]|nr:YjcZ family sporulation protein [Bacillus sp. PS06]